MLEERDRESVRDRESRSALPPCAGLREEKAMTKKLQELLAAAKKLQPSTEENEQQRRSFAFGNTNIENPQITRETVDKEAEELKRG
jgi:hypothetical protein